MANNEILLYNDIGGFGSSAAEFIDQVKSAGPNRIDLRINSAGGSVFDGYAIFNALKRHVPGVNVYIDGLAASIASYIAMAGTRVSMAKNAMLMIHRPSGGMMGGTSDEMRRQADVLDEIQSSISDAYAARTGIPAEEISKMLDEETWLDANQALAFGFIDEITPELAMAAQLSAEQIKNYKHIPENLRNAVWTTSYINNLADSAFLYIEDGGSKDGEGKTKPRSLRHFPYRDAAGKIDLPHLRNALARIPQSNLPQEVKDRVTKKAQSILADNEQKNTMETEIKEETPDQKPSIFARVSAMLKEKSDLVELKAKHEAEIKAEQESHAQTKAQLSDVAHALSEATAKVSAYQAAEKELTETIEKLQAEKKSASDEAQNIVASLGFDQTKLPAPVSAEAAEAARLAAEPKTTEEWQKKYLAIKDPVEQTKFLRENGEKIWAARAAERRAAKGK